MGTILSFERGHVVVPVVGSEEEAVQLQNQWAMCESLCWQSMRARGLSERTVSTYREAFGLLESYLIWHGGLKWFEDLRAGDIEGFLVDLAARPGLRGKRTVSPATVANRFRSLRAIFAWMVRAEYLARSPMAGLKVPRVPVVPVKPLSVDEVRRLVAACGTGWHKGVIGRRDAAIIILLFDTGLRRDELACIEVDKVDFGRRLIEVRGKGSKYRKVHFGVRSEAALLGYLKARVSLPGADGPELWLGRQGPVTGNTIAQMLGRRARAASIEGLWAHRFRHTFAHMCLEAGMLETDLMTLAGWSTRTMVDRYAGYMRESRAHRAHEQYGPGEKL